MAKKMTVAQATFSYLGAKVARRDAERLLDIGYAAAVEDAAKVLEREPEDLDEAILFVAAKEASDIIDLYGHDPEEYPQGRTIDLAYAHALKSAKKRYHKGKCCFCKGPALPCAKRHAHGRSCV